MKNNCFSRFFSLLKMALKRTFHLWRTVSKHSTFVECHEHDDCTVVEVSVHMGGNDHEAKTE